MSDECRRVFYQLVGVCGEVTFTPEMACGPVTVTCLDHKVMKGRCPERMSGHGKCRLTIFQELCVAVPVTFDVDSECQLTNVVCLGASDDPSICLDEAPET